MICTCATDRCIPVTEPRVSERSYTLCPPPQDVIPTTRPLQMLPRSRESSSVANITSQSGILESENTSQGTNATLLIGHGKECHAAICTAGQNLTFMATKYTYSLHCKKLKLENIPTPTQVHLTSSKTLFFLPKRETL